MKLTSSCLMFAAVLAGCGGGGGDSGSVTPADVLPTPPLTYAVAVANRQLLTSARSWTTSGTSDGKIYNFGLSINSLDNGIFPLTSKALARTEQSTVFSAAAGGAAPSTSTSIQFYNNSNDELIGSYSPALGTCTQVTRYIELPAVASVGARGELFTTNSLSGCDGSATVTNSGTVSWSLEVDENVVLFCRNISTTSAGASTALDTVNLCVEVGTDGMLGSKARITLTIPSLQLSLVTRTPR